MTPALSGTAVITGASGGIGRATARALAACGMRLYLSARDIGRLRDVAMEIEPHAPGVIIHPADLSTDQGIRGLAAGVASDAHRLNVLIHAAGTIRLGNVESAEWGDLDEQYRVNLRAPFLLTKAMLPMLKETRGQVAFIVSTAGYSLDPNNGVYAATKHALRTMADGIRNHVNPYGIRVVCLSPGRTATPMQEVVHRFEGRPYEPAELVQPDDIAALLIGALKMPRSGEVTDIFVRPLKKPADPKSK